jgi:hypothetical protein
MRVNRERYQHGSVRKVPRSQGFAWKFKFYITAPDGKRKLKVQTFDSAKYPKRSGMSARPWKVSSPPANTGRTAVRMQA